MSRSSWRTGARWAESLSADRAGDLRMDLSATYLRGTKTKAAKRTVPVVGVARSLLAWVVDRVPEAGPMFKPWGNVRRDLAVACAKLGIAPVTPNDLRRTFGTWLRNDGIAPNLIGAAMGHTDSRMVERVYGRLTPEALGKLLNAGITKGIDDGQEQPLSAARESRSVPGALLGPGRPHERMLDLDGKTDGRRIRSDVPLRPEVEGAPTHLAGHAWSDSGGTSGTPPLRQPTVRPPGSPMAGDAAGERARPHREGSTSAVGTPSVAGTLMGRNA